MNDSKAPREHAAAPTALALLLLASPAGAQLGPSTLLLRSSEPAGPPEHESSSLTIIISASPRLTFRADTRGADADVLVDSTKHPSYALILRRVKGISLRSVHIVRDGRGVAFAWSKEVGRPEIVDRLETMPRYGATRAAGQWLVDNLLIHLFGRRLRARRVLYESLVSAPRRELEALLLELGRDPGAAATVLVSDDAVELEENHTVAGNPLRFRRGRVELRLDEEWRDRMERRDRLVVNLMTWPLLAVYHYRR